MEVRTEFDTTPDEVSRPLLLHSLAEFREVILPCLDAAGASSVVEIGSEEGTFTRELLTWAEGSGSRLNCIDPAPAPALVELAANSHRITLIQERSLDALEHLDPCDAYLIDGDHNYYTVGRELRAIAAGGGEPDGYPLVFVHDVGWPAGRRDMYYSPESIPAGERHQYAFDKGVVPWRSELVEGGFRGEGLFAWALHEGGDGNGVMTAVEDFLRDCPDLAFVTVPCIFGLGVLYPRSAAYAAAVAAVVGRYHGDGLVQRLEVNRVHLYLRVLQAQDEMARLRGETSLAARNLQAELEKAALHNRDVQVENRALWGRVAELEDRLGSVSRRHDQLAEEAGKLLRSRSMALAERISQLYGRLRNRPTLSRAGLRALVDETLE